MTSRELARLRHGYCDRCIRASADPWERLWLAVQATRWFAEQARLLEQDKAA